MFLLDKQLQADTCMIGELSLCRVLLMNDARYPWCILVPRRNDIVEVFELPEQEQQQLWHECSLVSRTMRSLFDADKMNIAALGNLVRQLHVHIIARSTTDDAWPGPVWGKHAALPYSPTQHRAVIQQLRQALRGHWTEHIDT